MFAELAEKRKLKTAEGAALLNLRKAATCFQSDECRKAAAETRAFLHAISMRNLELGNGNALQCLFISGSARSLDEFTRLMQQVARGKSVPENTDFKDNVLEAGDVLISRLRRAADIIEQQGFPIPASQEGITLADIRKNIDMLDKHIGESNLRETGETYDNARRARKPEVSKNGGLDWMYRR